MFHANYLVAFFILHQGGTEARSASAVTDDPSPCRCASVVKKENAKTGIRKFVPWLRTGCLLIWSFLLPGLPAIAAQAVTDTFRLVLTVPVQARFATADNLGHIYLITNQNTVEKYAADGRLLSRYTNNRLGNAASLDVTNPLKILVWYVDFRTVVFLDRSLTTLGELNLVAAGFPEIRALASATDGNLWLYDEIRFQLRKISPGGETYFESQPLSLLQTGRIQISCLYDTGQELLAADPDNGILWFDTYGQLQKVLPWKGIAVFQMERNQMMYLADHVLHFKHLYAPAARTLPLPAAALIPGAVLWLAPGRLFVQNGENLEVFSID